MTTKITPIPVPDELPVGTEVCILNGLWKDQWTTVTEIIPPLLEGDPTRYEVAAAPGRGYYREELAVKGESRVCSLPDPWHGLSTLVSEATDLLLSKMLGEKEA